MARLSSRLHKIKGALRAQPVDGHAYDSDLALDLGESEFVSIFMFSDFITYASLSVHNVCCVNCIVCVQLTRVGDSINLLALCTNSEPTE